VRVLAKWVYLVLTVVKRCVDIGTRRFDVGVRSKQLGTSAAKTWLRKGIGFKADLSE